VNLPTHHSPSGRFRNPWPNATVRGLGGMIRWKVVQPLIGQWPPEDRSPVPPSATPTIAPEGHRGLTVTWFGHSTALLQLDGVNLLTDPVWSNRASPLRFAGPRRRVPPPAPLEALPRLDAVLLSHNHYDHLDRDTVITLARLHPATPWVAPLGLAPLLREFGVREVRELDWWGETSLAGVTVAATPAQHFSARGPFDRNLSLWCGYAVRTPSWRVWFAGDTGYHPEFRAIGERHGPFDLALIPIGAYDPRWFMRPVHLDAEEAVQVALDLRAAHPSHPGGAVLPIHWGTFKLTDEPMDEPPRRAREAWGRAGLDPDQFWLLKHGETRRLRD
jgi:N-acyl-phosphatidylethanolamine-hydrolysing phospholipase D